MTAESQSPLYDLVNKHDATIPAVLKARALESGSRTFLLHESRQWTFAQAWAEACSFATFLRKFGVDPEDRVACYSKNCPQYLWAWFGSLLNASLFVAIHRNHRGILLRDMLARSRARILVTDREAAATLDLSDTGIETVVFVDGLPDIPLHHVHQFAWPNAHGPMSEPEMTAKPTDTATILFTSGTAGRSKAVLIPHNQFCRGANAVASAMQIDERDCFHAWPPLSHIGGLLDLTMAMVIAGGRIALVERFSASSFWSQIKQNQSTLFIGFTNLLEILQKMPESPQDGKSSLRAGLIGFVPAPLRNPFEKRFGVELFDIYGMTEAEPIALPQGKRRPPAGSCGQVNPDFHLAILDDQDREVPCGKPGEIAVRKNRPGVMFKGYENDREATRHALRGGWFHTGDIGLVDDDGNLFFKDRKKQIIRRGGENISSWELEMIVTGHPDILECAAIGIPSIQGDEELKIVIAPHAEKTIQPDLFHQWCKDNMAKFMVPRFVEILSEIPRTDTGKIEKEKLRSIDSTIYDASSEQGSSS